MQSIGDLHKRGWWVVALVYGRGCAPQSRAAGGCGSVSVGGAQVRAERMPRQRFVSSGQVAVERAAFKTIRQD